MKTSIIIISMLISNAICYGQQIDSVQIWPHLPIEILKETSGYEHFRDNKLDTCWINKDSTFLIFRYIEPPKLENITYSGDSIFFHYNDRSIDTLFMMPTFDSAVQYYKKKKVKTYPIQ